MHPHTIPFDNSNRRQHSTDRLTIIHACGVLLQKLNSLSAHSLSRMGRRDMRMSGDVLNHLPEIATKAIAFVKSQGAAFRQPDAEVIGALLPSTSPGSQADEDGNT